MPSVDTEPICSEPPATGGAQATTALASPGSAAVSIFPVRHHSPAASLHLARLIRERRPRAIVIEGPADADALIPYLLDPASEPPLAIYAYRTDLAEGDSLFPRALHYPLCRYSPEYVALRVGQEVGAELRFCDLPAAVTLAWPEVTGAEGGQEPDGAAPESVDHTASSPDDDPPIAYHDFTTRLAAAAGFDTFDAFWEAAFEQDAAAGTVEHYLAAMTDFGAKARASLPLGPVADHDARRERHMAAMIASVIAGGVPPEDILVVCGAAHATAIANLLVSRPLPNPSPDSEGGANGAAERGLPSPRAQMAASESPSPAVGPGAPWAAVGEGASEEAHSVPTALALLPFSYPRLSEQLGYGAGNRAPWFYGRVWDLDNDYAAAARHALVALAAALRRGGHLASLAQVIDAANLATTLAALRGKRAPGIDEVSDAATACLGQGQPAVVADALRQVLIGEAVGRVTPKIGRTPLQAEFYATAARLRLPVLDAPKQILVHLPVAMEAAQSVFLHRLVTADVPFGHELESGLGGRGRAARGGALAGLGRALEKWEIQWSPATDARLIEQSAWGGNLAEVCGRLLAKRLSATSRVDEGTGVLLEMALCDVTSAFPAALAHCEGLAADSTSFPALARAAHHLDGLLAYGAARRLPVAELTGLAERLFARAALHLPAACVCGDDDAREVIEALPPLAELARRYRSREGSRAVEQSSSQEEVELLDSSTSGYPLGVLDSTFWQAVERVAARVDSHPLPRGLALTLLELDGRLAAGELARRLRAALSIDAAANAHLIAGVFTLHRGTLVRNRALIGAVTDFLLGLSLDELVPLLPGLRQSLGQLSGGERTYLFETLAALLGLQATAAHRLGALTDLDTVWLSEADAAVATVLTGWKERYGLG